MTSIIVFGIFIGLLFIVPFFTKRRLGTPGLALVAGSTLAHLWVGNVTPIVASAGLILVRPPLESVVFATITLLPALLLIFSGPTYSSLLKRLIGSAVFALLAAALLLETFGSAVVIEGPGKTLYDFLLEEQPTIITLGLVLAIMDLLLSKKASKASKTADKH